MDFESFIWIIIFLIYVASVIYKRTRSASKAKKSVSVKKPSGWMEKLIEFQTQFQKKAGGFLAEIQREMEAAKLKDSKQETGWEKFLPPTDEEPILVAKEDDSPEPIPKKIKTDVAPKVAEPIRKKTGFQKIRRPLQATPSTEIMPSEKKDVAEKKDIPLEIKDLKRAVIWAEILAPPLALRDE